MRPFSTCGIFLTWLSTLWLVNTEISFRILHETKTYIDYSKNKNRPNHKVETDIWIWNHSNSTVFWSGQSMGERELCRQCHKAVLHHAFGVQQKIPFFWQKEAIERALSRIRAQSSSWCPNPKVCWCHFIRHLVLLFHQMRLQNLIFLTDTHWPKVEEKRVCRVLQKYLV